MLILCVFVLTVLCLYWGVLYQQETRLGRVRIAVVDFDGQTPYESTDAIVGPAVVAAARADLTSFHHLGYEIHSPADYQNDPMAVRVAVHDERLWGAIIINSNATYLLREAIRVGNSSYDPSGAAQIIYNQARDPETYNQFIIPALVKLTSDVSASFSQNWLVTLLNDDDADATFFAKVPQAISPAIGFTVFNLRPFGPVTTLPAISVGLIYLIIIAFFSFGFFMPTHMKFVIPNPASPHPPLKFYQLVAWRYCAAIVAYFFMSLFYSMVSLAYQIPFSHSPPPNNNGSLPWHWSKTEAVANANYYRHATFVVYWMINFVGMSALGLACENMAMLLGTPWTALWLIFWVITNVATGFYSLELAPAFYRWGYAWPLRQIVMASRTLLFGTLDQLGLNFGILVAWVAVGTALYPLCCWVLRWKTIRAKQKEAKLQSGSKS